MQTELEKIDAIRSRMDVSFEQARAALREADGDVVEALITLEQNKSDLLGAGLDLLDDVQRIVQSGGIRKLRLKFAGHTLADYPVALTAAGAIVVALAGVIISKSTIEIEEEQTPSEGQAE